MVISSQQGMLIDWGAKGKDRIAQNVRNLIHTYRYEITYHRTMGIPVSLVDRPENEMLSELEVEVAQLITRYEPRAVIKGVNCTANRDGEIMMEVILA